MEHTLFSLPILFAGTFLANGKFPSVRLTGLILLAAIGARILALALNRMIDVKIDARNPRTAQRELVTGALSLWDATLVAIMGLLMYLWAASLINPFCLMWSWVPALLFAIYPTLKRFTWLCHFGLGVTWAMAPLAGWFAVRPGFDGSAPAWVLAIFSFLWLAGFDIIYATMDETFDRREGLFSLPSRFGKVWALRVSALTHLLSFVTLFILFFLYLQGPFTSFLCLIAGVLLALEHMLVDNIDLAFFKINVVTGFVVGAMVYIGVQSAF
jgi:4-hydroxybenzoate polyprenyltransferase